MNQPRHLGEKRSRIGGGAWKPLDRATVEVSVEAEVTRHSLVLANTEPVVGAQRREPQSLQWFLSESRWDPQEVNERRLELMLKESSSAPSEEGVLVIDEHGDPKWGKKTAHAGSQ